MFALTPQLSGFGRSGPRCSCDHPLEVADPPTQPQLYSAAAALAARPHALTPPPCSKSLTSHFFFSGDLNIFPGVAWDPLRGLWRILPQPLQHTWPWLQELEALRCSGTCQKCHGRTAGRGHRWWGGCTPKPLGLWGTVWLTPAHLWPSGHWILPAHTQTCPLLHAFHQVEVLHLGTVAATYSGRTQLSLSDLTPPHCLNPSASHYTVLLTDLFLEPLLPFLFSSNRLDYLDMFYL